MDYDEAIRLYGIDKPDLRLPAFTDVRDCFAAENLQELAVHPDRLLRMGESALKKIEDYSIERAVEGTVAALNRLWKERRQFK